MIAARALSPNTSPSKRTPSTIAKTETRPDGVAVVTLDDPAETHNTITPALGGELSAAIDAAIADPKVRAIVVRSGKRASFLAGANIGFVRSIRFAADAEEVSREVARRFSRIASSKKPVVAYVHGPALGGGFELVLACTAAVVSDDPKTVLGLPEVKLGLVPAANGLFRIGERAGLRVALDLGVTGRNVRPHEALRLGLVDEVVAPSIGLDTAVALALRLTQQAKKRKRLRSVEDVLIEGNPLGRYVLFRKARARTAEKTRGHYPAAERVIDLLALYGRRGFRAAAAREPEVFGDLVVSETAHRLIDVFFTTTAVKKDSGLEPTEKAVAFSVENVGVIGAGLMGAGIAGVSARAGASVRLKDTDDLAVGRGLRWASELLQGDRAAFARMTGTTDDSGFRHSDLVIEAVYEDLDLKHTVLRGVEKLVRETCVIASNTSSIPIARIAEVSTRPEMVVGMHYARPVHKMPLLEVIRTKASDPRAVATAVAFGKRQGKTAIVVRDGVGFYTTRTLVPYLNEALHLLAEGVSIEAIDTALLDWGFPTGPLALLDEVGIDLAASATGATEAAFGARMAAPRAFALLGRDDRKGRKNGRGFYLHGGAKRQIDPTVYGVLEVKPGTHHHGRASADEISLRCSLAFVNEALRCHGDGVLRGARDGDAGAILGLGFPAFRGGPFRYVDVLGAATVLRRTRSLEQRFGARFEPAPLLVEMARAGKRFYA